MGLVHNPLSGLEFKLIGTQWTWYTTLSQGLTGTQWACYTTLSQAQGLI